MADPPINDYYVITSRRSQNPDRWGWEIHRNSKPLGIKMTGDGFQSEMAAQFAGKQALSEFLAELSKEEKTPTQVRPPHVCICIHETDQSVWPWDVR